MHKTEIKPHLQKILQRLWKKDKVAYEAIMGKIQEVSMCEDVEHYKNLRYGLKSEKSVHIMKSFVLVFSYDKTNDIVSFLDYDHHDNIYAKGHKV